MPKIISKIEINNIIKDYKKHKSLKSVARKYNRSSNTVRKYVSPFFKINTQQKVERVQSKSELKIEIFIGFWIGDGTRYRDKWMFVTKFCSDKNRIELGNFIYYIIQELFGYKASIINETNSNRQYIRCRSKFIFYFPEKYVNYTGTKTYTVNFKKNIEKYSLEFLKGVLIGLTLSDGYFKKKWILNMTSKRMIMTTKKKYLKEWG